MAILTKLTLINFLTQPCFKRGILWYNSTTYTTVYWIDNWFVKHKRVCGVSEIVLHFMIDFWEFILSNSHILSFELAFKLYFLMFFMSLSIQQSLISTWFKVGKMLRPCLEQMCSLSSSVINLARGPGNHMPVTSFTTYYFSIIGWNI